MTSRIILPFGETVPFLGGYILGLLERGPMATADIKTRTEAMHMSWSTVQRAKAQLDVYSYREGDAWYWTLDNASVLRDRES